MNALHRLTQPLEPNAVIDAMLEGRLLRWRATSSLVSDICARTTLEQTLERIAESPSNVLVRVPFENGRLSRRHAMSGEAAVRLFSAFDGGGAIQVPRASDPMLAAAAEEIAQDLELPPKNITLGLFVSKRGHVTALHNDDVPGISIQLAGKKTWSFANVLSSPNRPFENEAHLTDGSWERAPERPDESFVVEPGDAMIVPAGRWHSVSSDDDAVSMLASISFAGVRWVDALAETVRCILVRSPLARSPWLHGGSVTREQRVKEADELLETLRDALAKLDVGALVGNEEAPKRALRYRWNPAAWYRPTPDGRLRFGVAGFFTETGICRFGESGRAALVSVQARPSVEARDLLSFFANEAMATRFLEALADLKAVLPESDAVVRHAAE